jgi:hypothetical protein
MTTIVIMKQTGDRYEGVITQEDENRIWLKLTNGNIAQIMKLDIAKQYPGAELPSEVLQVIPKK